MSKKTIKIKFVDMPGEFDKQNNFIIDLLREKYNVDFSDEPDYIFYSVFGIEYLSYRNCVRIFMDGEPVVPNFNDCDYAIGYTYMSFGDRYHRAAGVLASSIGEELPESVQDRSSASDDMVNRRFCNFIYSNATLGEGAPLRIDFCEELMKYKHVDCPGRVLNNMKTDELETRYKGFRQGGSPIVNGNSWQDSKMTFQSKYKFTIAFENMRIPGMTTEKLINPLLAYSVPIYWGNPDVAREFNPKAFINCEDYDNDLDRVIQRVIELDQDDEQYLDMLRQPPLRSDFDFHQRDKLRDYLYMIIERGNHPVRNPVAVDCWEPVSANLILRWGGDYQTVHSALKFAAAHEDSTALVTESLNELFNSDSYRLAQRIQAISNSKLGFIPKKIAKALLGRSKEKKDIAPLVNTNTIDFSRSGNSIKYTGNGWYGQEDNGRWTEETAEIRFVVQDKRDRIVKIYYKTHPSAKATTVLYNGEKVGILPYHWAEEYGTESILLPGVCAKRSGIQVLTLYTEGATTSKAYYGGDVTDERLLGVNIHKIVFSDSYN